MLFIFTLSVHLIIFLDFALRSVGIIHRQINVTNQFPPLKTHPSTSHRWSAFKLSSRSTDCKAASVAEVFGTKQSTRGSPESSVMQLPSASPRSHSLWMPTKTRIFRRFDRVLIWHSPSLQRKPRFPDFAAGFFRFAEEMFVFDAHAATLKSEAHPDIGPLRSELGKWLCLEFAGASTNYKGRRGTMG